MTNYKKNGFSCIENCGNKVGKEGNRCKSCTQKEVCMKRLQKIYCCMECGDKISPQTALGGSGRCRSCATKGKNNPAFIDGKTIYIKNGFDCIRGCGNRVSHIGLRCKYCTTRERFKDKRNHPMFGKKRSIFSIEWKRKITQATGVGLSGKDAAAYIDGRTPLHILVREFQKYKDWRIRIFERDNFTCRECFIRGGNLEAHHKKRFSIILQQFLSFYNQFSPIEDKETLVRLSLSWPEFWDIENGETLCKDCHNLTKLRRVKLIND